MDILSELRDQLTAFSTFLNDAERLCDEIGIIDRGGWRSGPA
jgi:hypothetical protein